MAKIIDYPRSSFKRAYELAEAVDYMGGNCSIQSCADKMGAKVSGAFQAIVGAAKKYDLIDTKGQGLTLTALYRTIKLAYDDNEKISNLRTSFLSPPLFRKVYDKFKGRELPVELLPKLFIREYGVDSSIASRVSGYFVDGARFCELLIDNKLIEIGGVEPEVVEKEMYEIIESPTEITNKIQSIPGASHYLEKEDMPVDSDSYVVHITGPGMNSKLTLLEEEDFLILEAMVRKLKKKMKN